MKGINGREEEVRMARWGCCMRLVFGEWGELTRFSLKITAEKYLQKNKDIYFAFMRKASVP